MRPYVTRGGIASVEMEEHRSGGVVHYVDHLAALESARAEAFRMGQEEMRVDCLLAVDKALGWTVPQENARAAIRAIPLKDNP